MDDGHTQQYSNVQVLDLGPELLSLLVDLLPTSDLKSLSLTNSAFTQAARYGLFRAITLELPDKASHEGQERLSKLQTEGVFSAVRTLEVVIHAHRLPHYFSEVAFAASTMPDGFKETVKDWAGAKEANKLVCWCITTMTGLKELLWHGPSIAKEVLDTLQSRHEIRLSMMASNIRHPAQLDVLTQKSSSILARHSSASQWRGRLLIRHWTITTSTTYLPKHP